MEDYLLLIDGSGLLSTQYYGNLPNEVLFAKTEEERSRYYGKIMQTSKGVYTNAIFGFMRTFAKIIREQRPAYLAVAWDKSRNTFRREISADYKANRSETPQPLKSQFVLCEQLLERIGVRQFMDDRYEADDFCGTLARRFEDRIPVRILTKDNDYLQLVTDRTNLWMMHATAKKTEELYKKYKLVRQQDVPDRCFLFTPELVKAEFGIEPLSVADLKGLSGDPSDNIKGVPGVGPATATALLAKYGTIEAIYEAMEGLDEKGLKALAASWKEIGVSRSPINSLLKESGDEPAGREAAFISKRLATIRRDIDLGGLALEELALSLNGDEAAKAFSELEFKSLKADFGTVAAAVPEIERSLERIDDFERADRLFAGELPGKACAICAVFPEQDQGMLPGLFEEGIALCTDSGSDYYIACSGFITRDFIFEGLKRLDGRGITLCACDFKSLLKFSEGMTLENAYDVMIAEYLLDPLKGEYSSVNTAGSEDDAVRTARSVLHSYESTVKELENTGMTELFKNIEMPLVFVLAEMERTGILVRKEALTEFAAKLNADILRLEKEIYERAGEEFNINSPKQLGVILFEKLRLPYSKKTKSGYSTSADVLEKLKSEDPIVEAILEYRQYAKLKSTYAEGLYDCIDADGRIRTRFNQTVTATGRLSSTEPNLQNIPIRTELGRMIRKAFVPAKGCCFVDADYSQIELRILAALSGDEKLISAYRNSEDIHRATASAVFHVPFEDVTPQLRSRAKAVNFGIVYGISSFGLGNGLNISRKEAEEYIAQYFATYPSIKKYLDSLVKDSTERGYALTYFNRRRPIPELSSTNYMQRQFGERIAMNTPIQGTAADIIKIAMIRVARRLKEELPEAKLLLQVHDELLVEVPEKDARTAAGILEEEMKAAASLSVSLEVGTGIGADWYEAH